MRCCATPTPRCTAPSSWAATSTGSTAGELPGEIGGRSRALPSAVPRAHRGGGARLVVAAGCVLALGQGVKHVVDNGFGSGDARPLDQALAAMIVVAAALAVATWFRFYLMMSTGERVITDLRRAVVGHILALEPAFFEATRTGEVISRLTNDTAQLQQVIGYGFSKFVRNLPMMAA